MGTGSSPAAHGAASAAVAGVALAVFLATVASSSLAAGAGAVPVLWLANGVAVAAMLLGGAALWPGIALGAGVGAGGASTGGREQGKGDKH